MRDTQGKLITKKEAVEFIRSAYKVPEETRQARRRRKPNGGRLTGRRTREAAKAPQSGPFMKSGDRLQLFPTWLHCQ